MTVMVYFLGLEEVQGECLFGAEALLLDQPAPGTGSKGCGALRQDKPLGLAAGLGSLYLSALRLVLFSSNKKIDTQINKEPGRKTN